MYAERFLRFVRDRPTICGAKTSRHGRNGIFGTCLGNGKQLQNQNQIISQNNNIFRIIYQGL